MHDNNDAIAHLPMVFMGKLHQFFQHLASFLQNSINTNNVELGNLALKTKHIAISMKLAAKFIKKMAKHIENNLVPKDIPAFAKSLFFKQVAGCITLAKSDNDTQKTASHPTCRICQCRQAQDQEQQNQVKRSQGRSSLTRA